MIADSLNSLTRWIPQTYQLVPQGLVFNLATDRSFHESSDTHLRMRGLLMGRCVLPRMMSQPQNFACVYGNADQSWEVSGAHNQHERAILAFKEALARS